jgi:UDP-2,3-diacylglucosamine pyrophosphatase LpxH
MAGFDETLAAFGALLRAQGYILQPVPVPGVPGATVKCVFTQPIFQNPVIAIPDVHLSDAGPGDIFLARSQDAVPRLVGLLTAVRDLLNAHPASVRAVQLGDWFDVWRAEGGDVRATQYGAIENAAVYRQILDLDAQIGLAHLVGNHDASFLRALPDRRAAQPALFRLGFWLGQNVYALHGHQTDITPPTNLPGDQFVVAAATTIAEFIPGVTTLEAYVDRFGTGNGIKEWLLSSLGLVRVDPDPPPRPADPGPLPPAIAQATLVLREARDDLARIARQVSALPASHGRSATVVIVGHSHNPCVSVSRVGGAPVVIIDAGSWTYGQANVLVASADTAAVFNVVPA